MRLLQQQFGSWRRSSCCVGCRTNDLVKLAVSCCRCDRPPRCGCVLCTALLNDRPHTRAQGLHMIAATGHYLLTRVWHVTRPSPVAGRPSPQVRTPSPGRGKSTRIHSQAYHSSASAVRSKRLIVTRLRPANASNNNDEWIFRPIYYGWYKQSILTKSKTTKLSSKENRRR